MHAPVDPARARQVTFWTAQLERLDRRRLQLTLVPALGLPLAGVCAFAHPLLGGAGITITLLIWLNGLTQADAQRAACEAQLHAAQQASHG